MEKLPRDITLKYLIVIATQKQGMAKTLVFGMSIGNITVGQPQQLPVGHQKKQPPIGHPATHKIRDQQQTMVWVKHLHLNYLHLHCHLPPQLQPHQPRPAGRKLQQPKTVGHPRKLQPMWVSIGNMIVGQPHPAVGPKTHKTAQVPTT